nr:MAG TPA: hypothetical protein [Caudoviricetes sp.]
MNFGPLFHVTDVTNVTRKRGWAKKVGQGVTRIVGLFLGIATKSRGGPFFVKYIN